MTRIIGFTGPAGSGKTTLATSLKKELEKGKTLMEMRIDICPFAYPLKTALKFLFNFSNNQLYTLEGKEDVDPRWGVSPRKVMQAFGTEFIRKIVPGFWVLHMKMTIEKYHNADYILIDDVRFSDEAAMVRELGGVIVHILGRKQGKATLDISLIDPHASEQPLPILSGDLSWLNNQEGPSPLDIKNLTETIDLAFTENKSQPKMSHTNNQD